MRLEEFDFELPTELIAQVPLADRSASRLLVLHKGTGQVEHKTFKQAASYLQKGDLLVMNDTRVTARRLTGRRASGGAVEALVLRPRGKGYEALTRPAKKLRLGDVIEFEDGLLGTIAEELGKGMKVIEFDNLEDAGTALSAAGAVPLPPYITATLQDEDRYQTVYAAHPGSAAAPTAGLHFTREILGEIESRGVKTATVTLDVGLDTFRPVQAENVEEHVIHGESCSMPPATAEAISACRGRVFAVGTTSVRTLETFAIGRREVQAGKTLTRLFITPGFEFKVVDAMFTNFHLPRTTMLLMVSALTGRDALMSAYREAVEQKYRFLSFGDSMLVV